MTSHVPPMCQEDKIVHTHVSSPCLSLSLFHTHTHTQKYQFYRSVRKVSTRTHRTWELWLEDAHHRGSSFPGRLAGGPAGSGQEDAAALGAQAASSARPLCHAESGRSESENTPPATATRTHRMRSPKRCVSFKRKIAAGKL